MVYGLLLLSTGRMSHSEAQERITLHTVVLTVPLIISKNKIRIEETWEIKRKLTSKILYIQLPIWQTYNLRQLSLLIAKHSWDSLLFDSFWWVFLSPSNFLIDRGCFIPLIDLRFTFYQSLITFLAYLKHFMTVIIQLYDPPLNIRACAKCIEFSLR